MNTRERRSPDMAELDRQTGEVLAPWFASETVSPPPPAIMQAVQSRIPTTHRRHAWRIPDWWVWRRSDTQQAGYVLATAASVLLLAVTGLTSAGIFLVATNDAPGPGPQAPVAGAPSPEPGASAEPMVGPATPEAVEAVVASAPPDAVEVDAATTALPETVIVKVAGALTQAPTVIAEGTSSTPSEGVTDISGIETEATVAFDDERLSGTARMIGNERHFEDEGIVARGRISIENEGGSWSGTFDSVTPPGRDGALQAVELTGAGGYDGLGAMLHYDLGRPVGDPGMITGVIAPGTRPPVPDRARLNAYADFYKDPTDLLGRFAPRAPSAGDRDGLPAAVAGSLETTYFWKSGSVEPVPVSVDPDAQVLHQPEWMAGDLMLADDRLRLEDYEVLLDIDYYDFLDGSLFSGVSRGRSADGGGWSGEIRGFSDPDETELVAGRHFLTVLTGTGAYEGLSAILFSYPQPTVEALDTWEPTDAWSVDGMLFRGASPPYPAAP